MIKKTRWRVYNDWLNVWPKIGTHLFDVFAVKGNYHDNLFVAKRTSIIGIVDDIIAHSYYLTNGNDDDWVFVRYFLIPIHALVLYNKVKLTIQNISEKESTIDIDNHSH